MPPRIGEFNESQIVVDGKHAEHWLSGQNVVSFETGVHEESPISLQNHSSETWFRNIRIRRL